MLIRPVIDEANAIAVATAAEVPAPVVPGLSATPVVPAAPSPGGRRNPPRRVAPVLVGAVGSGIGTAIPAVQAAGASGSRRSATTQGTRPRTPLPSGSRRGTAIPAVQAGASGSRRSAARRSRTSTQASGGVGVGK
jgi:hypothetical protein